MNPRYEAFCSAFGPNAPNWQFFQFISDAKKFAHDRNFGVVKRRDGDLSILSHDMFTLACFWYAQTLKQKENTK